MATTGDPAKRELVSCALLASVEDRPTVEDLLQTTTKQVFASMRFNDGEPMAEGKYLTGGGLATRYARSAPSHNLSVAWSKH